MVFTCFSSYYEKFADGQIVCIDEEVPFEIPSTWEWRRLSSLFQINPKNSVEDNADAAFIPMEKIDATYQSSFSYYVRKWREIKSGFTHFADGDVAFAKITPCFQNRKSMILKGLPNGIGAGTTELKVLRTYGNTISTEYLLFFLESPYFVEEAIFKGTANQQRIISGYLENKLFPIPPQKEQQRIVDIINASFTVAETYSKAQEKLDSLNNSLAASLRKSILQEAIQGKLVPQDPNEESASILLQRIREEKERLVKEGKLKKKDVIDSTIFRGDDNKYFEKKGKEIACIDDEIPFEIPESLQWCRVKQILDIGSARRVHQKDWRSSGVPFYRAREIGKLAECGHVDNELFIDYNLYKEFSSSGVPMPGDLMVTAVGTLGKVYIVKDGDLFYYKDGSVLCLNNRYNLNPSYLKCVIESPMFINQFVGESQGTTVATLTMVRFNEYLIPVPPLREQERIVKAIDYVASIMSN